MKKFLICFLLLMVAFSLTLGLFSCQLPPADNDDDKDKTDDETQEPGEDDDDKKDEDDETIDWDALDEELDGLVLISGGKARFRIVYTASAGSANIRAADNLYTRLTELGIELDEPVSDREEADVSECELIIGANARHRGEDCNVNDKYLGKEGYAIKAIGKRVVIAGGAPESTQTAIDIFLRRHFKITSTTTSIDKVVIDSALNQEKLTEYSISSIKIDDIDLSEYTLVTDLFYMGDYETPNINNFCDNLYDMSGYALDIGNVENLDDYDHYILIRFVDKSSIEGNGFYAYVDSDGNFIVECAYANVFDKLFAKLADELIFKRRKDIEIPASYSETYYANRVYYSDFATDEEGKKRSDYEMMLAAHQFANDCGQTVYADLGAVYNLQILTGGSIPVKTNVELGSAKIVVDDTGSGVYAQRSSPVFRLVRDYDTVDFNESKITELFGNVSIKAGATEIPWLADVLVAKSMVRLTNSTHRDYVRFGGNNDSGYERSDIVVVNEDGTIDTENSPLVFDFDKITKISIIRVDDAPITFNGGYIETVCNRAVSETNFQNKYDAYSRGIVVNRSNSTVKNVKHRMVQEPELDREYNGTYGRQDEGYPYHAFLDFSLTYNSTAEDLDLTGHTTYYETKSTSATPVPMGSYDIVVMYSINTFFNNVDQNGVSITDQRYWGIMASNGVKNINFTDCSISRFDAHRGFWRGSLINCDLGFAFNVIGGGTLYAEGVRMMTTNNFISLRGDYGATFEGDITLKDCQLLGCRAYNTNQNGSASSGVAYSSGIIINSGYAANSTQVIKNTAGEVVDEIYYHDWNFGYTCFMPQNITLDNFKYGSGMNVFLFNDIENEAFKDDSLNRYQITKSITYRNMHTVQTVQDTVNCKSMADIPVKNETYPAESSGTP